MQKKQALLEIFKHMHIPYKGGDFVHIPFKGDEIEDKPNFSDKNKIMIFGDMLADILEEDKLSCLSSIEKQTCADIYNLVINKNKVNYFEPFSFFNEVILAYITSGIKDPVIHTVLHDYNTYRALHDMFPKIYTYPQQTLYAWETTDLHIPYSYKVRYNASTYEMLHNLFPQVCTYPQKTTPYEGYTFPFSEEERVFYDLIKPFEKTLSIDPDRSGSTKS